MPTDVEGGVLREELQFAVGQMVMDPPGDRRPVEPFLPPVDKPGYDDTRHGAHPAIGAAHVPDVAGALGLVGSAAVVMLIAVRIDFRGSISRTDGQTTEAALQRRLRNCINGMRAQNFDFGAPELVELELYLMSRARGMPVETPAVRP